MAGNVTIPPLPCGITEDDVVTQLTAVLNSPVFVNSRRASGLLRFIVDHALAGTTDMVTQSAIGVAVLGRDDYDPTADSHVRVEIRRLRDKLREYYAELGRNDAVVISLRKGSYVPEFTRRHTIENTHVDSPEAFQLYLSGRRLWAKRTPEALKQAKHCFQEALAQNPDYAPAHIALSECYVFMAIWGWPPLSVMPEAKRHAQAALERERDNGLAHALVAFVNSMHEWNWAEGEKGFKLAAELDPYSVNVCCLYSSHLIAVGRKDDAIRQVRRAQALDTMTSVLANSHFARVLYVTGEHEQALELLLSMLDQAPNYYPVLWNLGMVYLQINQFARAVEFFEAALELAGQSPSLLAALSCAFAAGGRLDDSRRILNDLLRPDRQFVCAFDVATVYSWLGDLDRAFKWMDKAFEERALLVGWINMWPLLKPLRSDRRFSLLPARLGLHDSPNFA